MICVKISFAHTNTSSTMSHALNTALELRAQCKYHAAKYGEPDHDADLALARLLATMSTSEVLQYIKVINPDPLDL